jgi:hypothetical protein
MGRDERSGRRQAARNSQRNLEARSDHWASARNCGSLANPFQAARSSPWPAREGIRMITSSWHSYRGTTLW